MISVFTFAFISLISARDGHGLYSDCASLMAAIHYQHSVKEVSAENTRRAKDALRMFRVEQLQKLEASPSLNSVNASSDQPKRFQKVADRIKGIEQHYEDAQVDDDSDFVIAGSVIEGREKILEFLEKMESENENYNALANDVEFIKSYRIDLKISLAVIFSIFPGFLTYLNTVILPTASGADLVMATLLNASSAMALAHWAYYNLGSVLHQLSYSTANFTKKILPSATTAFNRQNGWQYASRDLELSDILIDEIWKRGAIHQDGVVIQELNSLMTRKSNLRLTFDSVKPTEEEKDRIFAKSPVSVDMLFRTEEGKEKLILFLRFKHQEDFPPGREKDSDWLEIFLAQLLGQKNPS